jgi:hypothetical protein
MTFYLSGVMVAQNNVLLDPTLNGTDTLQVGDTGTFSVDRAGEPSYDTIVSVAEPAYPLDLNPATLNFGGQRVNTTSPAQNVTVTNNGSRAVSVSIPPVADFPVTNGCPPSLPAGQSCNVSVQFKPSKEGPETATLTINTDEAGNPDTVLLTGTGLAPLVSLTPSGGTDFGSVALGQSSAPKLVTLTNVGDSPLTVYSVGTSGNVFVTTNACPAILGSNISCAIYVAFAPSMPGPGGGILILTDDAFDSPQQLAFTGVGLGPQVVFNPPYLNFGDADVAISQLTVTITNTGNADLVVSSISTSGPFTVTPSGVTPCPLGAFTLRAGGPGCTVTVTFLPVVPGLLTGYLLIADNAGGHAMPLSGNAASGRGPTQAPPSSRSGPPPPVGH